MSVTVRAAMPGDVGGMMRMVRALAAYEREADAVVATEEMLAAALFRPDPRLFAHVALMDGRVVGMAVWFLNFSTWTGRHGLYVEDLYVDGDARRHGVARALFEALAREARARDCARIDWAVLGWNEEAKRFYRRIGGRAMSDWEPWRLDGEALARLGTG